jgi:hypothetical protein
MHELRLLNEHDASQFWQFRLTGLEECPQAFTESADELQSSPVDVTVLSPNVEMRPLRNV